MTTIELTVSASDSAWIEKRLSEGRHLDAGEYIRDLVRQDQDGRLPDRGTDKR